MEFGDALIFNTFTNAHVAVVDKEFEGKERCNDADMRFVIYGNPDDHKAACKSYHL